MKDTKLLTEYGIDLPKSLELFGDMETYDQMLNEFLSQVKSKLEKAKEYKNSSDLKNYEVIVHSLKSDFRYFGAEETANCFYKHEMAAKEGDENFIENDFDNLLKEADKMINVFKAYMGADVSIKNSMKSDGDVLLEDRTILVVDDSNIIRTFLEKIFHGTYNTVLASNGEEALSIIKNTPLEKIECMLLDLNMPKTDGFAVLEYLKAEDLFYKLPVSIITGMDDEDTIKKAFQYPIVDMIQKPFNEEKVRNVTIKTIERKDRK